MTAMQDSRRNVSPIVLDIETCALVNAATYLDPVTAARNLKDPQKIAEDIEKRTAERLEKLALDFNVGRIAALGYWTEQTGPVCYPCVDEEQEAAALTLFWGLSRHRTIIGFNCKVFDLRYMVQRSRYLNVSHPTLDLGRYGKSSIIDLYGELTFNDGFSDGCMRRSLKSFARRFGLDVPDDIDGADIQKLVDANDWTAVTTHCLSDIELTKQLAIRLGYINVLEAVAVGAL